MNEKYALAYKSQKVQAQSLICEKHKQMTGKWDLAALIGIDVDLGEHAIAKKEEWWKSIHGSRLGRCAVDTRLGNCVIPEIEPALCENCMSPNRDECNYAVRRGADTTWGAHPEYSGGKPWGLKLPDLTLRRSRAAVHWPLMIASVFCFCFFITLFFFFFFFFLW